MILAATLRILGSKQRLTPRSTLYDETVKVTISYIDNRYTVDTGSSQGFSTMMG